MSDYLIQEQTLTNIADAIRSKTGTSAKINPDDMDNNIENIVTLNEGTSDANAVAADLLTGKTAYVNGAKITGTMTNQGTKTSSLNCGDSYTIPEGYHNGSGKVTANTLASQTSADATAAQILSGKTAWVNGNKLTGTLSPGVNVNNWKLTDWSISQKNRSLSITLDTTNTYLIVCNAGEGEGGSDPDFMAYAQIFLVHQGKIIFGAQQRVGYSITYGLHGSVNSYSIGSDITTSATMSGNVFTYTQIDPDQYNGTPVYSYSIWKLN